MYLDRFLHIKKVSDKMYIISKLLYQTEEFCEDMRELGLYHDIGYYKLWDIKAYGVEHIMDLHAELGANYLDKINYKYSNEVRNHGKAESSYSSLALDILNLADMTTNSIGDDVSFKQRYEDIVSRYGENSEQAKESLKLIYKLEIKFGDLLSNKITM